MGKKSPCLSCKHKNVYEPLTKCFVCNFSGIECKNFEMYKPNSQTNADKIRSMTDEELAGQIAEWNHGDCPPIELCPKRRNEVSHYIECAPWKCWLDWLKKEAE